MAAGCSDSESALPQLELHPLVVLDFESDSKFDLLPEACADGQSESVSIGCLGHHWQAAVMPQHVQLTIEAHCWLFHCTERGYTGRDGLITTGPVEPCSESCTNQSVTALT